ncbi:MAG: hypothetical protein V1899_09445 [Planctomycetota bacterium]
MSSQIDYWKETSDYDIETAEAMLKSLTEEKYKEILDKSKELQIWIKQRL